MEMDILQIMGTELKILVQTTNLSCNNESQDDVGIGIRIISAHYLLDGLLNHSTWSDLDCENRKVQLTG